MRLKGKTALVTGGTRGIGAAIVSAFVENGARVVYSGRSTESVDRAASTFSDFGSDTFGVVADLERMESVDALAGTASKYFDGQLDILVNNAGVISRASEWELTPEEWDRVQAVNVRATYFLCQAAGRAMCNRKSGSIVNISSIAGQNGGLAGSPAYGAAKAAVIGITRSLARRFGPFNVRVNCIAPADIETAMTAGWPEDLRERLIALTPLDRFGKPEEVSSAAVFFACSESAFITGQTLSVNGGAYMN